MTYSKYTNDDGIEMFVCEICKEEGIIKEYPQETTIKRHITMKHKPIPDPVEEMIEEAEEEVILVAAIAAPEPEPSPVVKIINKMKKKMKPKLDKHAIVKATHKLWREQPGLAPLGWKDNKEGEK